MAGFGGSTIATGFQLPQKQRRAGRLMVFALDGKATAPAYAVAPLAPAAVVQQTGSAAQIEQGRNVFAANCLVCHGADAIGGTLPDLRRSMMITTRSAFNSVLIDGALEDNGMVSFKDKLTPDEIEAVRLYLGNRAANLAANERRPAATPLK
jgi:mono/diheme cytochrome c family protein